MHYYYVHNVIECFATIKNNLELLFNKCDWLPKMEILQFHHVTFLKIEIKSLFLTLETVVDVQISIFFYHFKDILSTLA